LALSWKEPSLSDVPLPVKGYAPFEPGESDLRRLEVVAAGSKQRRQDNSVSP
jgi:hypothetical protein